MSAACEDRLDLIPPKRSGTFWVNVYPTKGGFGHDSKRAADEEAGSTRLACIEVHWEEGAGL